MAKHRLLLIGIVSLVAAGFGVGSTTAFFHDQEFATENAWQAGELDLELGADSSSAIPHTEAVSLYGNSAFFDYRAVLPGKTGRTIITANGSGEVTHVCAEARIEETLEHSYLPPEIAAGDATSGVDDGELQDFMHVAMWYDENEDGLFSPDNGTEVDSLYVWNVGEQTDVHVGLVEGELERNQRWDVGVMSCFGVFADFSNPEQGCSVSGSTMNQAQSDSLAMQIIFHGVQYRGDEEFYCQEWIAE